MVIVRVERRISDRSQFLFTQTWINVLRLRLLHLLRKIETSVTTNWNCNSNKNSYRQNFQNQTFQLAWDLVTALSYPQQMQVEALQPVSIRNYLRIHSEVVLIKILFNLRFLSPQPAVTLWRWLFRLTSVQIFHAVKFRTISISREARKQAHPKMINHKVENHLCAISACLVPLEIQI